MPYPAQTDRETIIQMAQTLIERDGVEQLSLARLGATLGVKAPSLYRHIASKTALLQAVIERTFQNLFQEYDRALADTESAPTQRLLAIFRVHRTFAHAHPRTYILAFTTADPDQQANAAMLEQGAIPIQELMAEIAGAEHSLAALRGALALIHGFVMLELNGQFRRGGVLETAFEASIQAYLAGWQSTVQP